MVLREGFLVFKGCTLVSQALVHWDDDMMRKIKVSPKQRPECAERPLLKRKKERVCESIMSPKTRFRGQCQSKNTGAEGRCIKILNQELQDMPLKKAAQELHSQSLTFQINGKVVASEEAL